MTMNPLARLRSRLGRSIESRVATTTESALQEANARLAGLELRAIQTDLMLAELRSLVVAMSSTLSDDNRAVGRLVEHIDRRLAAIESLSNDRE
jgi:hypothetical protein